MPMVSKSQMRDTKLVKQVAQAYQTSLATVEGIARRYGVNSVTAREMIRTQVSDDQFRLLKRARYARSKLGRKNPMYGKFRRIQELKHCSDHKGYVTRLFGRKRYFVHHIVVAEALGLHPDNLPGWVVVHHVDGDPRNNDLSNLVITTAAGHARIHERYRQTPEDLLLKKLTVRECIESMTST